MFPQGPVLSDKAKKAFKAKGLRLPQDWEQPTGKAGKQYVNAFKEEERSAQADAQRIFQPATDNKLHVDTAKQVSQRIEGYIDGICGAIATAWQMWMSQSAVSGVMINGPIGALTSGCVQGPPLTGLIMSANPPMRTPGEIRFTKTISKVVGDAWRTWHTGLSGSLNYPAFAAFPAPVAPPMPNSPAPVSSFGSPGLQQLTRPALSRAMEGSHNPKGDNYMKDIFDTVSAAVDQMFLEWSAQTQLQNVLGTGPVPTFAPPLVPVGPVLAGVGNGSSCFI